MVKNTALSQTLVIVESPAKCKKIEQYLGPGYKCMASFGHLRELGSLDNVNIENNFAPTYTIVAKKKKQIAELKAEIKKSSDILLATDDDREGEAIAWHICQLFNLDVNKTKRIIFHEITETAIQNAARNPIAINMNLVHAQQARQVLDLLVGFKITPQLWKHVTKTSENSLSAGRCQTPALKIIYDNQQEINNTTPTNVYKTTGLFTNQNILFDLNIEFETEDETTDYLDGAADFAHIYTCSSPVQVTKKQPEPFTTSRMQQVASNECHFSPKESMKLCQSLYEGGYITYMRTDSKTYSKEFLDKTKAHVTKAYGAQYVNKDIGLLCMGANAIKPVAKVKSLKVALVKKTKTTKTTTTTSTTTTTDEPNDVMAQEAHEAIRPTDISLMTLPDDMDSKEKRMYKLIWHNTMASCMPPAIFFSVTAKITSFQNTCFVYHSEIVSFPGFMILNPIPENKDYQYLQTIKQNVIIPYKTIYSKVAVKNVKQHYTEARLVQLLEERGIGRPSTFASLVDKIQERGYVKKENIKGIAIECKDYELSSAGDIFEVPAKREFGNEHNKLVIQQLGIVVMEFLDKNFSDIFNYDYTKSMEDSLDKILAGDIIWSDLCRDCNDHVDSLIGNVQSEKKMEIQLDKHNVFMFGRYGPVIKCTEDPNNLVFKKVRKDVDVHKLEQGEYTIDDILEVEAVSYVLGKYDGEDVVLKKGKYGLYISWGTNSKTLSKLGNRPMENITFQDVEPYLSEGSNLIRELSSTMSIRKSAKGDYIFYRAPKAKKPSFFSLNGFGEDYRCCDAEDLKLWIKETYNL